MTKKYDIRTDPKFMKRVAKLEGNQYTKVLRNPIRVDINGVDWWVTAIGLNDSYLIVLPRTLENGVLDSYEVLWTKSDGHNTPTAFHEPVAMTVLNWMMLHSNEQSFIKKKHLDVRINDAAIECCTKVLGQEMVEKAGPTFNRCIVQGTYREGIKNPLHR